MIEPHGAALPRTTIECHVPAWPAPITPGPQEAGEPSHLLGQAACEEGVQVLGIQPHETLEVLAPDVVCLVLLLCEF